MLVVTTQSELSPKGPVWGSGGWDPPAERESRDWVALGRFLGWPVDLTTVDAVQQLDKPVIVLTGDPDDLSHDDTARFSAVMEGGGLLLSRAPMAMSPFAELAGASMSGAEITGRRLVWHGPAGPRSWTLQNDLTSAVLDPSNNPVWATLDDAPVIAARRVREGFAATIGFHPSEARDQDPSLTALMKHLLIFGPQQPVAWIDLSGLVVLRMDDPGGAQNIYSRHDSYPKLSERQWGDLTEELVRRRARLSIGYIGGWVDDGDDRRGVLEVAGERVSRAPGAIHPSPLVRYQDLAGHNPGLSHDYQSEYRGIQRLRAAGAGDVELHGHTHMHPDSKGWAEAVDRYENIDWYREFGINAEATIAETDEGNHPLNLGRDLLLRYFATEPSALIFPGDNWTDRALEFALKLPLQLVSSYYLAFRHDDKWVWSQHVVGPYLDAVDASLFKTELPVIGYFHDSDVSLRGLDWVTGCLEQWSDAGSRKFIDFRELSVILDGRVAAADDGRTPRLALDRSHPSSTGAQAVEISFHLPGRALPSQIEVEIDGKPAVYEVTSGELSTGRVLPRLKANGPARS